MASLALMTWKFITGEIGEPNSARHQWYVGLTQTSGFAMSTANINQDLGARVFAEQLLNNRLQMGRS